MKNILIKNARIYTLTSSAFSGWLLIDRKKILNFHKGLPPADLENENLQIIDAAGKILLPGFIDTHTHGSLGFCTMDADPDKIRAMARRNAEHGVTSFLPTSLTDKKENILQAIKAASSMVGTRETGSKVLGIHLEGPFFNPVKAGAQDPDNIRRAQKDEIAEYLDAGIIKQISMAPEYSENLSAADIFVEKGNHGRRRTHECKLRSACRGCQPRLFGDHPSVQWNGSIRSPRTRYDRRSTNHP